MDTSSSFSTAAEETTDAENANALRFVGHLGVARVVSADQDATVDTILAKAATIQCGVSLGRSCEDKSFTQKLVPLAELLDPDTGLLTRFGRGQKNGDCIVFAELQDGQRKLDKVVKVYALALDLDTGTTVQEAIEALARHGWFAVIYTTHSHDKSESHVPVNAVYQYAREVKGFRGHVADLDARLAIDFLRDRKKYREWVLEGATVGDVIGQGSKEVIPVRHHPLPKLRIIIPFAKPFDMGAGSGESKTASVDYRNAYHAVGEASGLAYDTACSDAVRLHYTPRISHEAQIGEGKNEIVVVDGKAPDFEHYAALGRTRAANQGGRGGAGASRSRSKDGAQADIQDFDLFLAHSQDFQAADAVAELAPDTVVASVNNDSGVGVDAECPAVELHTEQKPGDRRFGARNATEDNPWTMFCLGTTCSETSGKDRVSIGVDHSPLIGVQGRPLSLAA